MGGGLGAARPHVRVGMSHKTTMGRPQRTVPVGGRGGMAAGAPPRLTPPPTSEKFSLRKKLKFIKGAQTWRSILDTQTVFQPLPPPPPRPGYGSRLPLSHGLAPGGTVPERHPPFPRRAPSLPLPLRCRRPWTSK